MRTMYHIIAIVSIIVSCSHAQYWGERVAEKSFEHADFFFQPSFLNPYGIGGFGSAVVGLIDDPLLNLHLNPALLSAAELPKHHIYINFRSDVTIRDRSDYYVHPAYDYRAGYADASYSSWYPRFYTMTTRKAVEPVIALAYLLRPFSGRGNYTFGVTYQAVFQDERYYEIPQNIYRSQLGVDYAGRAVADESNIPVIDRYHGEDEMHQQGHFVSLINSIAILPYLDFGLRLSRVTYRRDGSFGSTNLWDNHSYYYYTSARDYLKNRRQDYDHWDALVGIKLRASSHIGVGLALGLLDGEVTQDLSELDISRYTYGVRKKDKNWGTYDRQFHQDQSWRHDGRTIYGSVHLNARLSPTMTLCTFYRTMRENLNLHLTSALVDTSFSEYRNEWQDSYNDRVYIYESESNSKLTDLRQGGGDQTGGQHQTAATIQWQVDEKTRLDFGINWSERTRQTLSCEQVLADRFSLYGWRNNDQEQKYDDAAREDKNLHWHFNSRVTSLQIPLFLHRQLSPKFELVFGVNRKMTQWRIDDVTEAWYNYKEETINGETKTRGQVIERYTSPREVRTDIETVMLGGIVIKPAQKFNIRLMAVPTYIKTYTGTELDDLQWWLDFNLFP